MGTLITGAEVRRAYSFLGGRPFRNAGAGLSGALWQPWHLSGCAAAFCTNTAAYPNAVHLTGGNVDTFYDLSGNGRDLLQAVAGSHPRWGASGSGGVLGFDGTDDKLKASPFALNQPDHIFVLGKYTTGAATAYLWDGNTADSGACYRVAAPTNNSYVYAGGGAAINLASANATWTIYDANYNGASSLAALNGAAPSTANIGAGNKGGFALCSAGNGNARIAADIAAVVVYNRSLAESDRQRVIRWMRRQAAMLGITIP